MSSAGDLILGIFFIFVLAFCAVLGYTLFANIQDGLAPMLDNTDSSDIMVKAKFTLTMWDKLLPIAVIFFLITTLYLAKDLTSHPMMFFISLIMLVIVGILAVVFSNIFEQISEVSTFSNATATFGVANYTMDKLPIIFVIGGLVVLAFLFIRARGSSSI